MKSELVLPAPAKLNLFLHITGRRPDGYHALQTLFQFLDYGDELGFTLQDSLALECNLPELVNDDNLILKAARLLQQETGTQQGALIRLDKRLPMGGGVGGGSSDAATTLLALNTLWGLQLSEERLAELGLQLGADVPVFVRGSAAFAEGVGEILTPVHPPEYWYLVLVPDCHVNTVKMYAHRDLTRDTPAIKVCAALETYEEQRRQNRLHNDFEPLVRRLYPEVESCIRLLDNVRNSSIGRAMMSGSGACVFVPFASREQAESAKATISSDSGSDIEAFIARGVNTSPLHSTLHRRQAVHQLEACST